tara:strand:- start:25 stop:1002 length:978 start_codon:yes stop_codon:yes gene_type:complete
MTTITRELINPNFYHVTENVDYKTLCKKINKFKHLFLSKGATKEDNIGTGTLTADTDTIACYFAAWELGMTLFLTNDEVLAKEHSKELLYMDSLVYMNKIISENFTNYNNRTYLSSFMIHDLYRPIDPNKSGGMTRMDLKDGLYRKILEKYGDNNTTVLEMRDIAPMPGTDIQPWKVDENDIAVENMNNVLKIKKTTDFWFPKQYTHKEVLESVQKYLPDFTHERVALSKTPHHNNSLDYYFLPTLMTASEVYDINILEDWGGEKEKMFMKITTDYANKVIHNEKVERMLVSTKEFLDYMQSRKTQPYTHEIIFNVGEKEIVKTY